METPIEFSLGRKRYYVYPFSLGKSLVVNRVLDKLGLVRKTGDDQLTCFILMAVVEEHREDVLKLIAYCSLPGDECLNKEKVDARIKELRKIQDYEAAALVSVILSLDKTAEIRKHFRFDEEKQKFNKVIKAKDDSSSVTFGGKSIWGSIIDFAAERYGWTLHYILWGISYANLSLLIEDHARSIYLTDEERKKAHIPKDNLIVKANDTSALNELIKTQSWS